MSSKEGKGKKNINFLQVGKTIECGHCRPEKNYDLPEKYGIECECKCHMSKSIKQTKGSLADRFHEEYKNTDLFRLWNGIEKDLLVFIQRELTKAKEEAYQKGVREEREKLCNYLQWHFENALQDGLDLGKEAWNDDEPRVRVKWYLDVFIPRLKEGKPY